MHNTFAFTHRYPTVVSAVITQMGVSVPLVASQIQTINEPATVNAIWDTGATHTVISDRLSLELDLEAVGFQTIYTVNGERQVQQFVIDLHLPNLVVVRNLLVTNGDIYEADILCGMDVIALGDFALTHELGRTCFSFQTPSSRTIDFEHGLDV